MTDLDVLREKLARVEKQMPLTPLEQVLPALLDELEKLRGEREELREALKWYAMRDWSLLLNEGVDMAMRRDGHDMSDHARKALAAVEQRP
jgi:hypothetical protein